MPRLYVGNLPYNIRERDIEDLFLKFGRIRSLDLKTPHRGAPFAFIEFDDDRDADEAIHRRNGYDFDGCRLRVEFSRGGRGRDGGRDGGRDAGRGPPKRSDFRVIVTGLPRSASWQDLKDHMRRGGDIGYANTFGDGSGVVEYGSFEDMRNAIRTLDDSEFRNPFDKAIIRVREDDGRGRGGGGRRRSRSRSHGRRRRSRSPRRRSRSRSPARRRRSRSPAAAPASKKSRSRSRSPAAKSKSRSRSRSPAAKSKSRSRSPAARSKSRSRSPAPKSKSRSRSPAAKSRSRSRSRSNSQA